MAFVVGFFWYSEVERVVASFISNTNEVLPLTRALIPGSVFVTSMLTSSSTSLKTKLVNSFYFINAMSSEVTVLDRAPFYWHQDFL